MASYHVRQARAAEGNAGSPARRFFIDSVMRETTTGETFDDHPVSSAPSAFHVPENDPRHARFHQHRLEVRLKERIEEERRRKAEARAASLRRSFRRQRRPSAPKEAAGGVPAPDAEDADVSENDAEGDDGPTDYATYIKSRFPQLEPKHIKRGTPSRDAVPAGSTAGRSLTVKLPALSSRRRGGGGGAAASARELAAAKSVAHQGGTEHASLSGRHVDAERHALRLLETFAVDPRSMAPGPAPETPTAQLLHPPPVPEGASTLLDMATNRGGGAVDAPVAGANSRWEGGLRDSEPHHRGQEHKRDHSPFRDDPTRPVAPTAPSSWRPAGANRSRDVYLQKTAQQQVSDMTSVIPGGALDQAEPAAAGSDGDVGQGELRKSVSFDVTASTAARRIMSMTPAGERRGAQLTEGDVRRVVMDALKEQASALVRTFQAKLRSQHRHFVTLLSTEAGKAGADERLRQISSLSDALEQEQIRGDALVDDLEVVEARCATLETQRASLEAELAELRERVREKTQIIDGMIAAKSQVANAVVQTQMTMDSIADQEAAVRRAHEVISSAAPSPRRQILTASTKDGGGRHSTGGLSGSVNSAADSQGALSQPPVPFPINTASPAEPSLGVTAYSPSPAQTPGPLGETGTLLPVPPPPTAPPSEATDRGPEGDDSTAVPSRGRKPTRGSVVEPGHYPAGLVSPRAGDIQGRVPCVNMAVQTVMQMADFGDDELESGDATVPNTANTTQLSPTASSAPVDLQLPGPRSSSPPLQVPTVAVDPATPVFRSSQRASGTAADAPVSVGPTSTSDDAAAADVPVVTIAAHSDDEESEEDRRDSATDDARSTATTTPTMPVEIVVPTDNTADEVDELIRSDNETKRGRRKSVVAPGDLASGTKPAAATTSLSIDNPGADDAPNAAGTGLLSSASSGTQESPVAPDRRVEDYTAPWGNTDSGTSSSHRLTPATEGSSRPVSSTRNTVPPVPSDALLSPKGFAPTGFASGSGKGGKGASRRSSTRSAIDGPKQKTLSPQGTKSRSPSFNRQGGSLMGTTAASQQRESATRVDDAVARMKRKAMSASRIALSRSSSMHGSRSTGNAPATVEAPPTGQVGLLAIANFPEDSRMYTQIAAWIGDADTGGGFPIAPVFYDGTTLVLAFGRAARALDFAIELLTLMGKLAIAFDVLHIDTSHVVGPYACYDSSYSRGMQNLVSFSAGGELIVPAPVYKMHVTSINDVLQAMQLEVTFHGSLDEVDLFSIHKEGALLVPRELDAYDPTQPMSEESFGMTVPEQGLRMYRRRGPLTVRAAAPAFGVVHGAAAAAGRGEGTAPASLARSDDFERRHMLIVYHTPDDDDEEADSKLVVSVGTQKSVEVTSTACGRDGLSVMAHSTQTHPKRSRTIAVGPGEAQLALAPLHRDEDGFDSDGETTDSVASPTGGKSVTPAAKAGIPLVLKLKQRLTELYSCGVCKHLLTNAAIMVPCGHIFCRRCVDERMRIMPQDEYDDVVEYRCRTCRSVSFDQPVGCPAIDAGAAELLRRGALHEEAIHHGDTTIDIE